MAFFQKPVWCDNVEHNVKNIIYDLLKDEKSIKLFLRQIAAQT